MVVRKVSQKIMGQFALTYSNRISYLALSFSVYASVNLPSLNISHMNAAIIATESTVLIMSPVNNRPMKGCAILLHL